jgi:hypothetical protein
MWKACKKRAAVYDTTDTERRLASQSALQQWRKTVLIYRINSVGISSLLSHVLKQLLNNRPICQQRLHLYVFDNCNANIIPIFLWYQNSKKTSAATGPNLELHVSNSYYRYVLPYNSFRCYPSWCVTWSFPRDLTAELSVRFAFPHRHSQWRQIRFPFKYGCKVKYKNYGNIKIY